MERDMTKGSPLLVILKFTLPLIIGNIFQQLYNMADTIIVGRYVGANALAAVGSTGTIMFLIVGLAQGITAGFTVLTSQRFGSGRYEWRKAKCRKWNFTFTYQYIFIDNFQRIVDALDFNKNEYSSKYFSGCLYVYHDYQWWTDYYDFL